MVKISSQSRRRRNYKGHTLRVVLTRRYFLIAIPQKGEAVSNSIRLIVALAPKVRRRSHQQWRSLALKASVARRRRRKGYAGSGLVQLIVLMLVRTRCRPVFRTGDSVLLG